MQLLAASMQRPPAVAFPLPPPLLLHSYQPARPTALCECRDYRPMEHLDRYEATGMDDAFIDDVTEEERFAARLAAERELAERDVVEGRLTGRRRGLPAALEGARAAALAIGPTGRRSMPQLHAFLACCAACSLWQRMHALLTTMPAAEELDEDERRPRRRRRLEEAQAGMDDDEELVCAQHQLLCGMAAHGV